MSTPVFPLLPPLSRQEEKQGPQHPAAGDPPEAAAQALLSTHALPCFSHSPPLTPPPGKKKSKGPNIQRLVTPLKLQRKRARLAEKKQRVAKAKSAAADYQKLLALRIKEQRERRSESLAKKRASRASQAKPSTAPAAKE
ncbi:unnamed protein product [Closterium sp. NIES-53]